ncbi:MAG: exodeoxyribonuclease V subunit gamma, partial [Spirochaetes bacterium]|nr:exodeoxyribonuclease V subunit gamma [Spirochaetota bacterium]
DFYPVKEIRLEQNYRSSANILNAANSVIKYNTNRKSKKLWTSGDDGEPIGIYEAEDEEAEANFILQMIKKLSDEGYSYNDIGILFRMNSQSRPLEEILRENDISYKLIGAMKFFDRPEIRDILGYMRFFSNIDDEISLYRIINNPKRSIGNTTLLALMEHSKETNSPIYSTIKDFVRSDILGKRITPYLEEFKNLVEKYRELIFKPRNIAKTVQALVEEIDYKGKLITELKDRKKIIYRMNNINQLIQSISRYENDPDNFEPNIYEYLQRVSLSTKDDESNDSNSINMMSIHSAKGLEFKVVFIVGVEEGLLPHHKTLMESGNIEEERRLFYVAITRARERLFLSYPKIRIKFNELINKTKSGFIEELPQDILQEINLENELKDRNNFEALLKRWND